MMNSATFNLRHTSISDDRGLARRMRRDHDLAAGITRSRLANCSD
jgi:hypothetical protein